MDVDNINDPVSSEDINVVPPPITPPPTSPKYKISALLAIFALVATLPILVKSLRTRQLTNTQASTSTFASKVMISPGEIITSPGGRPPVYLSALAYDASGNPVFQGVSYEWSISSSGSLGDLKTNNQIATYYPLNSTGSGDLWVKATGTFGSLWGSAQICQGIPCPTPSPTSTPTLIPSPTPTPTLVPSPSPTLIPTPTPTSTLPIVSFALNSSSGTEGIIRNTTSQIKVTLSKASTKNVSVNYQSVGGTSTSGVDYKLSPGILTFSPGQTTKYIVLEIINDYLKEPSETILIDLYAPQNATLGTLKRLQFTILDND